MPIGVADFIIAPSFGGFVLLKYLIIFTMVIHLPFICMMIGGSALSIFFNILDKDKANVKYRRFARDLMDKIAVNAGVGILLGIVPMLTLIMLFWQLLYGNEMANVHHWWLAFALLVLSFIALYTYKGTFAKRERLFPIHAGSGALGVMLLLGAYFVFFSDKTLMLYPSLWHIVSEPIWLTFASNLLPAYITFIFIAFAVTGAGVLVLIRPQEEDYAVFVKRVALGIIAGATFLQPIIGFIELLVLPEPAVSYGLVATRIIALLVSMLICIFAVNGIISSKLHDFASKCAIVLVFCSLLMLIVNDHVKTSNVLSEQLAFLYAKAEASRPKHGAVDGVQIGSKVYKTRCQACHSIDGSSMLGPTLKGIWGRKGIVVTDGKEREIVVDEEYLKTAIQYPEVDIVKGYKNLMAPQNLTEQELLGVIEYLKTLK